MSAAPTEKPLFALPNQKKLSDLETEIARLEQEREKIRSEAKAAFVEQVRAALDSLGMKPEELAKALTRKQKVASGDKVAPKYRNPDNPSETWAGRGKQPAWLEARLKAGATLDSLKI